MVKQMILLFCMSFCLFISCSPSHENLGDTLRTSLPMKIKGFDPTQVSDMYSHICQRQVYEPLYEYKYLARPFDVEPCLASAMPEISEDGTEYLIHLKPGVYFTDDPAFPGGKGRELVADDFVYSVKRIADARNQSTGWWIFDEKIVGLNEFRKISQSLDKDDGTLYNRAVTGIQAIDSQTIRITLTKAFPYFKYILTMGYAAVVAHEVVDEYQMEFLNHPVGTGPYILKEWRRGLRVIFEKNPSYHLSLYPETGDKQDSLNNLLLDAGKPLPFVNRLEFYVYVEEQPKWLNFLRANLDIATIPKDNYNEAMNPNKTLRDEFTRKGIQLSRERSIDLTYTAFNCNNPILGKSKTLRQALSLSADVDNIIDLFYNGRAIRAQNIVPPGLFGYEEDFHNPYARFDLEEAKRKMQAAGYPGGKGLPEFEYMTTASTTSRQMAEHFAQNVKPLGVKIRITSLTWPEFLDRLKSSKYDIAGAAWSADYPDPENFLMLLYGPNKAPGENISNYQNPIYDSLFVRMATMQDSPERLVIVQEMKRIISEDCPLIFNTHRVSESLTYDWVKNYKPNPVEPGAFKYYRIDSERRTAQLESGLKLK